MNTLTAIDKIDVWQKNRRLKMKWINTVNWKLYSIIYTV